MVFILEELTVYGETVEYVNKYNTTFRTLIYRILWGYKDEAKGGTTSVWGN